MAKKQKSHVLKKGIIGRNPKDYKEDLKLRLYDALDFCCQYLHISSRPELKVNNIDNKPPHILVDVSLYVDSIIEFINSKRPVAEREYCILLNYLNTISKLLQ